MKWARAVAQIARDAQTVRAGHAQRACVSDLAESDVCSRVGCGVAPVSAGPVGRAAARGCEGAQRCEHDCQSRTPCAECEVTVVIL